MTSRTTEVSVEAESTGKHAAEVQGHAVALNTAVGDLRHSVIQVVRTSTTEVDRRRAARHSVDLPCRVTVAGQDHAARATDISEGGVAIRGAPSLQTGTRVALHIDAVGYALPCVVRGTDDGTLHVAFELDAAGLAKVAPVLQRLSERRAA